MVETRTDFRQANKAVVEGLKDLTTALDITPIHRLFPDQGVDVPILAKSADEVIRVAQQFGQIAEIYHHKNQLHTRFKARFGEAGNVVLDVFHVSHD